MEPAAVGALSLDALYGKIEQAFALDVRAQLKPSAWLLAVGVGLGAVAAFFLRGSGSWQRVHLFVVENGNDAGGAVDGRDQVYPVMWMVFAIGAFAMSLFIAVSALRESRNRVELRHDGLVRVSRVSGTKHFRYDAIASIEKKRDRVGNTFAVHVTTKDDTFLAISDFQMNLDTFADELDARRAA